MPAATDIMTPLWRGVVILRIITAGFAVAAIIVHHGGFDRPDLGWAALVGIVAWTVLTSLAYSYDQTRCSHVIVVDLLVTLGLMGCSLVVLSPEHLTEVTQRAPLLPTVWACGPVVAAAVHAGRLAGALSGVAVAGMEIWLRGVIATDLACDALLLIGTGFVLGTAATAARRATEQLRRAAHAEAAIAERERLARSIHDSVVQVLARVRSRGGQLGGEAGELARLAGEQEIALRSLFLATPPDATGEQDLAAALQSLASPRVELSVPGTAVPLPVGDVEELVAVVREALANTARHGGPEAKSWILVEDLGAEVVLTVRDNGPGVDSGQLLVAESVGRMGVSRSIRGRVADLGGTLTLGTGPGRGTEWEVRLARLRHRMGGAASPPQAQRAAVTVRVMVVDDHPIWRAGVARDLGERGFDVATAVDGAAALRIIPAARPDVVLMDLNFGAEEPASPSGAETTRRIIDSWPDIRVLVLSASGAHADVLAAVQAGASGYLVKSASVEELVDAVRRTAEGDAVFTPGLAGLVLGEYRRMAREPRPDAPTLTERETDVLRQVAIGRTARQIADALVISHRTVENHVQSALRKLQLHNRVELARYAIEHGLTDRVGGSPNTANPHRSCR